VSDEFSEHESDEPVGEPAAEPPTRPLSGIDLARAALARAREEARARGTAPARRKRASSGPST
jgi:hypothetical protein